MVVYRCAMLFAFCVVDTGLRRHDGAWGERRDLLSEKVVLP